MDSATKLHVPVTPGNDFYVSKPDKCSSIRLNFDKETLEDIEHGIQQLGKLMYENI